MWTWRWWGSARRPSATTATGSSTAPAPPRVIAYDIQSVDAHDPQAKLPEVGRCTLNGDRAERDSEMLWL